MPAYYPVFLDVKDKMCIVVGGGEVARRKVGSLLECGAVVKVVSPKLCPGLRRMAEKGQIEVVTRNYCPGDLEGALLAIAATDIPEVNRGVAQEAKSRGMPVNVVDNPELCTFILPSIVRRGDLVIAVSTGGHSPALAKRIRQMLEESFTPEYAGLLQLLYEVRQDLRREGKQVSPERWQRCLDPAVLRLLKKSEFDEAKNKLVSLLTEGKGDEEPPSQRARG